MFGARNVLIGFQKAYVNVWITIWKFADNIAKYKLMFVWIKIDQLNLAVRPMWRT